MMVLRGWLAPKVGAVLRRALEAALEQVPAAGDDEEPTVAQRRADALGLVAESALAGGLAPGNRGDRFQVTAHVATQALASSRVLVNATPGAISAETRELSPTATEPVVAAADLDAGQPAIEQAGGLHVGTATHTRYPKKRHRPRNVGHPPTSTRRSGPGARQPQPSGRGAPHRGSESTTGIKGGISWSGRVGLAPELTVRSVRSVRSVPTLPKLACIMEPW